MTIHEAIFSAVRQPLLFILYLLLTAQMALLLAAFRNGRSLIFRALCLLHLLLSFLCLWFPFMDIDSNHFRTDIPTPLPPARSVFTALPASSLFLYEALTALIILAVLRNMILWRKNHPTARSIKETMDLLPAGIAFGKADGTVAFRNIVMDRLYKTLTGKHRMDLNVFRRAISENTEDQDASGHRISLPDSSDVWQFSIGLSDVDGSLFTQLTAADVTEQAMAARKLEEKNKKLRDIHMRLHIYNKQADRIIIAQELLTARMAVHSEVGNVLLECRHYLSSPASFDEEKLLAALKSTNTYLLREYEEDDTARDPLTDAVEMAEAIGVDIALSGPVPSDDPYRAVLAAAINECASNAVKHADGDSLAVKISRTDEEIRYIFRSNGEAPSEPIRETGGLLSLRSLVERENGEMMTELLPEFTLTIRLRTTAHKK